MPHHTQYGEHFLVFCDDCGKAGLSKLDLAGHDCQELDDIEDGDRAGALVEDVEAVYGEDAAERVAAQIEEGEAA